VVPRCRFPTARVCPPILLDPSPFDPFIDSISYGLQTCLHEVVWSPHRVCFVQAVSADSLEWLVMKADKWADPWMSQVCT